MPPSIVFVGDKDTICKATMCQEYKEFLDSKNIDNELYIYENETHSFFNFYKSRDMYLDTLEKTIIFLQKHNYIKK